VVEAGWWCGRGGLGAQARRVGCAGEADRVRGRRGAGVGSAGEARNSGARARRGRLHSICYNLTNRGDNVNL